MRLIGLAVLIIVVSLVAPFDPLAGEGTKGWYLLEPPVDETSNVLFGILNQAPLTQWNRIATYDTEAACEYKRNEAVQASRDETLRLSKTSPLPKLEIFKGAYREIDRRAFITMLGGSILAAPLAAGAQPTRTPRVGILFNASPTTVTLQLEAYRRGLRELGWIEGQTVMIEYRWAEGNPDRLPALVAELVQVKVDVIVLSGTAAIRAARRATSTIPIVFVMLADPIASGFVQSLARPGGNMTGLASQFEELITKQLQLLKEAVPKASRVALLYHPESPSTVLSEAETAARRLGLTARTLKVAGPAEFESAFKTVRSERGEAIHLLPSPFFSAHRRKLIELATRYRLPAVYEFKNYVEDGGLMSYGPSINEMYGRTAGYVDRILKGAKPGDLPIERPTKFELVINLKTAKALGLTIPQSLLVRADEVIQ